MYWWREKLSMASFIKIRQVLLKWNPNKILRTIGLCRLSCWSANCTHLNTIVALPVKLMLRPTYPEPPWFSPCPFTVVWVTTRNSTLESVIRLGNIQTKWQHIVSRICTDARTFAWDSFQNRSIQQDRQRTIHVILKRVRETIVAIERK